MKNLALPVLVMLMAVVPAKAQTPDTVLVNGKILSLGVVTLTEFVTTRVGDEFGRHEN